MAERDNRRIDPSGDESPTAGGVSRGIVGELVRLSAADARWWLAPMLVVFLLLGVLLVLIATGALPSPDDYPQQVIYLGF